MCSKTLKMNWYDDITDDYTLPIVGSFTPQEVDENQYVVSNVFDAITGVQILEDSRDYQMFLESSYGKLEEDDIDEGFNYYIINGKANSDSQSMKVIYAAQKAQDNDYCRVILNRFDHCHYSSKCKNDSCHALSHELTIHAIKRGDFRCKVENCKYDIHLTYLSDKTKYIGNNDKNVMYTKSPKTFACSMLFSCPDVNCPFMHAIKPNPVECKKGDFCTTLDCVFQHPTSGNALTRKKNVECFTQVNFNLYRAYHGGPALCTNKAHRVKHPKECKFVHISPAELADFVASGLAPPVAPIPGSYTKKPSAGPRTTKPSAGPIPGSRTTKPSAGPIPGSRTTKPSADVRPPVNPKKTFKRKGNNKPSAGAKNTKKTSFTPK